MQNRATITESPINYYNKANVFKNICFIMQSQQKYNLFRFKYQEKSQYLRKIIMEAILVIKFYNFQYA